MDTVCGWSSYIEQGKGKAGDTTVTLGETMEARAWIEGLQLRKLS